MQKRNQKGFTLIELLIVVAIIGLLATLAIVSLNTARQKANDTKRVADLKSMQTALELFWNGEGGGAYPIVDVAGGESWAELETALATYLPALPVDPDANGVYRYTFQDDGSEYILQATLQEASNSALDIDINPTTGAGFDMVASDDTTTATDYSLSCDEGGANEYCLPSVES